MNYLKYMLPAAILLMFATGAGFGQQPGPPDTNSQFREQQQLLNTQLIDYTRQQVEVLNSMKGYIGREQYADTWDLVPEAPQFQQRLRNRGDDEFNYARVRLDSLKLKTMDAESKKSELKMKVLDYNRQLPDWWEKAEAEFAEKRRHVVQSGLAR